MDAMNNIGKASIKSLKQVSVLHKDIVVFESGVWVQTKEFKGGRLVFKQWHSQGLPGRATRPPRGPK